MKQHHQPRSPPRRVSDTDRALGNFELARAVLREFPPGFRVRGFHLEAARIGMVLRGGCHISIGDRRERYTRGRVVYRPPGSVLCSDASEIGAEEFMIAFKAHDGFCSRAEIHPRAAACVRRAMLEATSPDASSALALESLIEEIGAIIRATDRCSAHAPPWLDKLRDMLHADPLTARSLTDLGAEAGVHRTHVARTFRRFFGCTAGEYARGLRLANAANALACTHQPIAAIAMEHGFADQSHFTRLFRRAHGITPRAYRMRFRH